MFPASNIVCARRPLVESTNSVSAILDSANTEIKAFKMVTKLALNNTICMGSETYTASNNIVVDTACVCFFQYVFMQ